MQSLSITFTIGLDGAGRQRRSAPLDVPATVTAAMVSGGKLRGRMLYLLPYELREIQTSPGVLATFEGRDYCFVRLDKDGFFELRPQVKLGAEASTKKVNDILGHQ